MSSAAPYSQLGPDKTDLHTSRPFFVLPLPTVKSVDEKALDQAARDPNLAQAEARVNAVLDTFEKPVSDVYVLSHGWHRNYFSAVSSYDRLISRMIRLRRRGRLPTPDNYNPLFLCVHWSSEVGKDRWTDLSGRHDKPDYMRIAQERFNMNMDESVNILEDAFELFAALSAPDTNFDDHLNDTSKRLFEQFKRLPLINEEPDATLEKLVPVRVAAAWACYEESLAKGVRGTQNQPPAPYAGFTIRIATLLKFIVGAAGIGTVLALPFVKGLPAALLKGVGLLYDLFIDKYSISNPIVSGALAGMSTYITFFVASFAILCLSAAWSHTQKKRGEKYGVGWITGIAWAISVLCFGLPLVILLVVEYLTSWVVFHKMLVSERNDKRRPNPSLNTALAKIARIPNKIILGLEDPDSIWDQIAHTADSQMAFFVMQRRGTMEGAVAQRSLARILTHKSIAPDARLHFAGHSFGGLLVVNMAREYEKVSAANPKNPQQRIETLCTIEGAYASGWFKHERATIDIVDGTTASIFSEADTATGFYYPAANSGRLAAGSVGFSKIKDDHHQEMPEALSQDPCCFCCKKPHVHRPIPYASLADPPVLPGSDNAIINIDASKMIYEGAVASGGGHSDLYKDDVILLLWSVLHRRHMRELWVPKGNSNAEVAVAHN